MNDVAERVAASIADRLLEALAEIEAGGISSAVVVRGIELALARLTGAAERRPH